MPPAEPITELPSLFAKGVWKKHMNCDERMGCDFDFHANGWEVSSIGLSVADGDERWFISKGAVFLSFKGGACDAGCARLEPAVRRELERSFRQFIRTRTQLVNFW
jgi:hypothetical protein